MTEDQERKINTLRAKYRDTDSLSIIDGMERDLRQLIEDKRMADNPVFLAIFKDAEKRLNEINAVLMNDGTLSESDRRLLFEQKKVWKFIFDRFGMKAQDSAIAMLESTIDSKIAQ